MGKDRGLALAAFYGTAPDALGVADAGVQFTEVLERREQQDRSVVFGQFVFDADPLHNQVPLLNDWMVHT